VVAREMYLSGKEIFLDISFLDEKAIKKKLSEVYDVCKKYRGIDITKEPIPVTPCPHFFMGGIAVKNNHETNISNLFAVGEAASMYHGANRLGGNSLLAALYSGKVAAKSIAGRESSGKIPDFTKEILRAETLPKRLGSKTSAFPVMYIRDMVADVMKSNLGIVREDKSLIEGVKSLEYYLEAAKKIKFDSSVPAFDNYSLMGIIFMSRAVMESALFRKESRGAHYRSDYPDQSDECCHATIIRFDDGTNRIRYDREKEYES
jgi:succinate dehydrogenase / fumarate reductase flavoprotein subunit